MSVVTSFNSTCPFGSASIRVANEVSFGALGTSGIWVSVFEPAL